MPWINLTMRRGALTKEVQHAVMVKLTDALMFWEKIPDTPEARKKMKGWVYTKAYAAAIGSIGVWSKCLGSERVAAWQRQSWPDPM